MRGRRGARRGLQLAQLERLVAAHALLLGDARRNAAFEKALAAHVRPGSAVLELGAGTGLWAVAAAKLGARRVVAVERDPLLIPLIEALAQENGVRERVQAVCGDGRRLPLRREFDVVISETVGNHGLDEQAVELFARARRHFLARGGVLIPGALTLCAAPAREKRRRRAPPRLGRRAFESLALQFPRAVAAGTLRLLAPPVELLHVDLRRARPPLAPASLCGSWSVADASRVGGVAVWVRLDLAPGLQLSTLSGTHWSPILYGSEPLPRGSGLLDFHLEAAAAAPPRWEIGFGAGAARRSRSYSPLFAHGWMSPRLARPAAPRFAERAMAIARKRRRTL